MVKRLKCGLREKDVLALKAWARSNMNRNATAKELNRSSQNVDYKLGYIKAHTGLNPKNFTDLCKLLLEIRKEEASEKADET